MNLNHQDHTLTECLQRSPGARGDLADDSGSPLAAWAERERRAGRARARKARVAAKAKKVYTRPEDRRTARSLRIDTATNADELLTALANVAREHRYTALAVCGIKILREAADLCGVGDADALTKRQALMAIVENF
jgi:CO/xanthine dehydrogenase Mo-binding subunit